ncbi:MAG: tRNA (N6-threonylcarbamoyladenosine(37)-N6)-methyltransferase TrmO [Phycisphaerales bacterium]|jgi:tRNA-Thr(GGU) m(6)t(6)A37 methyltransferase TsaA
MENEKLVLEPIGIIHSPFKQAAGTPIQPAFAKDVEGVVEVYEPYIEGLKDLEGFERIWLIFWLHKSAPFKLHVTPYLDTAERGLFATRAPSRPNPIGMSSVKLLKIDGGRLHVAEIDILDGTPLLDIKPYVGKVDCFQVERSGWLDTVEKHDTKADNRFHKKTDTGA